MKAMYDYPKQRQVSVKLRLLACCLLLISIPLIGISQSKDHLSNATLKDSVVVNNLLQATTEKFAVDANMAMNLAEQARNLSVRIQYKKGEAMAIKYIGNAFFLLNNPAEALAKWNEALHMFEANKDNNGVADVLGNIGTFYYRRADNVKAIEYYLQSLKIAESIGYKKAMVTALNNIGGIYYTKSTTYDKALKYYLAALPLCEELKDKNKSGAIAVNVGSIYLKKDEDDKALSYFNIALKAFEESPANIAAVYINLGDLYVKKEAYGAALQQYNTALAYAKKTEVQLDVVKSLRGVGKVYMKQKDYKTAIATYREAERIANEQQAQADIIDILEDLAICYAKVSDYGNAFKYQKLFTSAKDSLYNADFDKKVATLQFDFELEKKQGQINLLTKDKALKDAELQRQRLAKNAFMAGLVLIFIIAFIIYRNYRAKVKVNKILDHQKEEIESLLLNILPVEVAKELQENGQATPRNYESVSVLFTDFKGFTSIADKMTPAELVEDLNTCFMAFDDIIVRHNLEKIKTIGDSYMCAGGIPTPDENHVYNMVKASLEIQEYIRKNNERRLELGLVPWEARVGVHVGPVVAGVVGKKKYAYDIWGSTVNIASRMESNGAPGRVNISSAVYEKVKEKYVCTYRGKIYAKNVGEVDMYFIERELQPGEPVPRIEVPEESPIKAEELLQ